MKLIDLTGNRYGKLVVRQYLGSGNWLCDCDCGNTTTVSGKLLRSGITRSCGCLRNKPKKDLTGKRFWKLVALEYLGESKWRCRCDCGNETITYTNYLTSGDTKSCGCLCHARVPQEDLTGMRFGKLTVLKYDESRGESHWICQCDCGNTTSVFGPSLKSGMTKSCGCLKHESYNVEDLTGQKFGRLTALEYVGGSKWRCVCECGNETIVSNSGLRTGNTRSCGCLMRDTTINRNITHGHSHSRLYNVYSDMKDRCYNPKSPAYKYYGGRGIKICDEWLLSFIVFEKWAMENGYDPDAPRGKCTIDRIDNDGNYEPSNCRWADSRTQRLNQRERRNDRRPECRRFKRVEQLDANGDVINVFPCIKDASIAVGCPATGITNVCRGRGKTSGGFGWRYADPLDCEEVNQLV